MAQHPWCLYELWLLRLHPHLLNANVHFKLFSWPFACTVRFEKLHNAEDRANREGRGEWEGAIQAAGQLRAGNEQYEYICRKSE